MLLILPGSTHPQLWRSLCCISRAILPHRRGWGRDDTRPAQYHYNLGRCLRVAPVRNFFRVRLQALLRPDSNGARRRQVDALEPNPLLNHPRHERHIHAQWPLTIKIKALFILIANPNITTLRSQLQPPAIPPKQQLCPQPSPWPPPSSRPPTPRLGRIS